MSSGGVSFVSKGVMSSSISRRMRMPPMKKMKPSAGKFESYLEGAPHGFSFLFFYQNSLLDVSRIKYDTLTLILKRRMRKKP
jgi:hypothetical protein